MLFKKRKIDKRILGVWLSDRELTTKNWVYPKHVVAEKLEVVEKIFGKLQFTFTQTVMRSEYEDVISEFAYRVIASDENSVVIETIDSEDGKTELVQWFFRDTDIIYVLSTGNIEFFRRKSA